MGFEMKSQNKKFIAGVVGVMLGIVCVIYAPSTATYIKHLSNTFFGAIVIFIMLWIGFLTLCKSVLLLSKTSRESDPNGEGFMDKIGDFAYDLALPLLHKLDQFDEWLNKDN